MGAVRADAGGRQLAVWAGVGDIWDSGREWGAECHLGAGRGPAGSWKVQAQARPVWSLLLCLRPQDS